MRKKKHEGLVTEPVIKELDTDMTLNLNIFPYTIPVPKSLQTPRQDGVSAPKYSNCEKIYSPQYIGGQAYLFFSRVHASRLPGITE